MKYYGMKIISSTSGRIYNSFQKWKNLPDWTLNRAKKRGLDFEKKIFHYIN